MTMMICTQTIGTHCIWKDTKDLIYCVPVVVHVWLGRLSPYLVLTIDRGVYQCPDMSLTFVHQPCVKAPHRSHLRSVTQLHAVPLVHRSHMEHLNSSKKVKLCKGFQLPFLTNCHTLSGWMDRLRLACLQYANHGNDKFLVLER